MHESTNISEAFNNTGNVNHLAVTYYFDYKHIYI